MAAGIPGIEHLQTGQRPRRVQLRQHIIAAALVEISCPRSQQAFDIAFLREFLAVSLAMLKLMVAGEGQEDEPDEGMSPL